MKISILAAGIATLTALIPLQAGTPKEASLSVLAAAAASGQKEAIARLRQAGQPGLDALIHRSSDLIQSMRSGDTPLSNPNAGKVRQLLDAVAQQRDAYASGLFWYTDFEAAKAAAKASGKRILSLRMLGRLDEEFSCANSRFFRTALYANRDVSTYLKDNYILHWKSVRPVPRITIDMGDGRRIERTITGNSIHYVLNADGVVLDALPGLYGPAAFLDALRRADSLANVNPQENRSGYANFHAQAAVEISRRWLADLGRVGETGGTVPAAAAPAAPVLSAGNLPVTFLPSATLAAGRAASKFGPEGPILRQMMPDGRLIFNSGPGPTPIGNGVLVVSNTTAGAAKNPEPITLGDRSAARLAHPISLTPSAISIPKTPTPTAMQAAPVAVSKSAGEVPILRRMNHGTIEERWPGPALPNVSLKNLETADTPAARLAQPISLTVPAPRILLPTATQAAPRALSKGIMETPILRQTMPDAKILLETAPPPAASSTGTLTERTTPALWKKLAEFHLSDAQLDEASRRFMMSKLPAARVSRAERSAGRALDASSPFARTLQNFEASMAEDTVRNEYLLHSQIHQWLATNPQLARDVEAMNSKVYAELFLTPNQDAWLGLVPENIYTALDDDGCPLDGGRSR